MCRGGEQKAEGTGRARGGPSQEDTDDMSPNKGRRQSHLCVFHVCVFKYQL